jgi:membrane dipeptidase
MPAPPQPLTGSLGLHQDAIVVDLHNDIMLEVQSGKRDITRRTPVGHSDLPRFREGGVDVQVFALFVHPSEADRGRQRVTALLDAFEQLAATNRSALVPVASVAEIRQLHATGRLAVVLAVENASALEGDPAYVDVLFRRGVRMMGLTWNNSNGLADGALESTQGGLTPLGVAVLQRMQTLGMIVDVSHLSEKSFWDVLAATHGPIVATHSNAAGLTPHRRNLTDHQLHALAERGGVVGVNFVPTFLGGASLALVLEHVTYLVSMMGADGVALGSDFDGFTGRVSGLEDVSHLPALTAALLDRGYEPETIRRILGGNALRVFGEVWGR